MLKQAHQQNHQLTQIMVEHDEVDAGGKSVKKSSKSRGIVKESKNFKGLKNLQRPLVWRNFYWSTDPLAIRYKELKSSDSFSSSFCWD